MDLIQLAHHLPEHLRWLRLWADTTAKLADIFALRQTAQGTVVFQLLIFFFGQACLDTHFFFFHLDHLLRKIGVFRGVPLSEVRRPQGCGFGLWGHNPMLAIPADNSFIFAVFSECRFSIPAPESHRSVALLTLYRRGFRKVISYSDGHSVVRSALCPHANQLGIYFRFERSKFCKLSANDKKSRYTAHQISGR